jgi:hypothetical protein
MSTIPDWAVLAICFAGAVLILLIPDRHRPWWEKKRD